MAVTLVPGGRLGVDCRLSEALTARVGADLDGLPWLDKRPLSLTREPSVSRWTDLRVFAGVRWLYAELEIGWRLLALRASGGRVRQADADMAGLDLAVVVRF